GGRAHRGLRPPARAAAGGAHGAAARLARARPRSALERPRLSAGADAPAPGAGSLRVPRPARRGTRARPRGAPRPGARLRRLLTRLERPEHGLGAADLELHRLLDEELLHHAVLHDHRVALRALAHPEARAVEGEAHRLGE